MDEEKEKVENDVKSCVDAECKAVNSSDGGSADESEWAGEKVQNLTDSKGEMTSNNDSEQVDNGNSFETDEMEKLIKEAENRGYLRGRNEKIEELMSAPGMYRPLGVDENCAPGLPPTEILANMRRSVWD